MQDLYDTWRMSPALEVDGFLFFPGFNGVSLDGHVSPVPREQIETAFVQVLLVLEEAGLDASAIVEVTSYHIGLRSHLDDFKTVWAKTMRPIRRGPRLRWPVLRLRMSSPNSA